MSDPKQKRTILAMGVVGAMLASILTGTIFNHPALAQSSTPTMPPVPTACPGGPGMPMMTPTIQKPDMSPVQTAVAESSFAISTVEAQATTVSGSISITYTNAITMYITSYSPFALARGIIVEMGDMPWVGVMFVWFIIALFIIVALMIARFVVSTWGVVQRIIALIKLIPGL